MKDDDELARCATQIINQVDGVSPLFVCSWSLEIVDSEFDPFFFVPSFVGS